MKAASRRIISFLLFVWIFSTISFLLISLSPGDPATTILRAEDVTVTEEQLEQVREELGLNKPVWRQYVQWLVSFLLLDWGESYVTQEPALEMLLQAFPATLYLSAGAFIVAMGVAVPLGVFSAIHRGTWVDSGARLLSVSGASVPNFLLGLFFIQLFAVQLGWFPSMGSGTWGHIVLPSLTLGIGMSSFYIRLIRSSFLESMAEPSLIAVSLRGVSKRRIRWGYIFRAALVPVFSVLGVSISSLIGGTVVIEVVFGFPGVGSLIVDSITRRDIPVIQCYTILMVAGVTFIQLISDVMLRLLGPGHYGEGGH
ncbi:nickel ABC transporter permease [Alteribacillus sp. JSM 102045]|uniref:nickel ABC transporter permease n=1 Tax=Alteribacillus sp. JSM 102045 TaxID=1562101 RepID=UPI0035C0BFC4